MSIQALKDRLPEYAKDLKLNLSSVLGGGGELSPRQLWGTALASAMAARNPEVIAAVAAEAAQHMDQVALDAAKAAAAIMAMNNIYYRFLYMVDEPEYAKMHARLRMQVIAKPGVDKLDFELWSLAVSAVHGCASCVKSHDRTVRQGGASMAMVQEAVRVAAVIHAVAATLEAESPRAGH